MDSIRKARKFFHYSNCYLYWCIIQIMACIMLIAAFFVCMYNNMNTFSLFFIELSVFLFMAVDLHIYFFIFGCRLKGIVIIEMGITIFSGIILCFLFLENFRKLIEQYDSALMISRLIIKVIRLSILGIKTSDTKTKKALIDIGMELNDNPNQNANIKRWTSTGSSKPELDLEGQIYYYNSNDKGVTSTR